MTCNRAAARVTLHSVGIIASRGEERLAKAALTFDVVPEVLEVDASDAGATRPAFARLGSFDQLVVTLGGDEGADASAELDPASVRRAFDAKRFPFMQAAQAASEQSAGMSPVRRIGEAADVADAIRFLAGNSFVTGTVIDCDGGLRIR